jgi:hypothetical protein
LYPYTGTIYVGIVNSLLTISRVSELKKSVYPKSATLFIKHFFAFFLRKVMHRVKTGKKGLKVYDFQFEGEKPILFFFILYCLTYG